MKKIITVLTTTVFLISCKTISLDTRPELKKEIQKNEKAVLLEQIAIEDLTQELKPEKEIIYVEKPMYVPQQEKVVKTTIEPGIESVKKSTEDGTIKPSDYTHAARIYEYNPDQVYEVYCQILRTTDIYLEPGEIVIDQPFVSDSERWIIGAGVNQDKGLIVQHVYIKPKQTGLDATLIINTNQRVYHIVLRSYNTVYMPIVKWSYPLQDVLPMRFVQSLDNSLYGSSNMGSDGIDPRFLSFNYKLIYNIFRKPKWMPERVYDDGKKTYLVFNEQVLQKELPGVFENKNDVINYRVQGKLVIIDKLIEKITVKYKKEKITIEKKRGE